MDLNLHFHQNEIWKNYDKDNLIEQKIKLVLDLIPPDTQSLLDIGCGNGIITNSLSKHYNVVGTDLSHAALMYLKTKAFRASSAFLPVRDKSFDIVFSSEMLEHLPGELLADTVQEFQRISRKYILITVPNDEYLQQSFVKCYNCGFVFHVYGHINRFSKATLTALFEPKYRVVNSFTGGPVHNNYNHTLLHIRQKIANVWFNPSEYTICPKCKNEKFSVKRSNMISKSCNLLNRWISPKKLYWLFVLFKKRSE